MMKIDEENGRLTKSRHSTLKTMLHGKRVDTFMVISKSRS